MNKLVGVMSVIIGLLIVVCVNGFMAFSIKLEKAEKKIKICEEKNEQKKQHR